MVYLHHESGDQQDYNEENHLQYHFANVIDSNVFSEDIK